MSAPGCVGILMAGGTASRFGGLPKGLALVEDMPIAERVLIALRAVTDCQIVVSNDPLAPGWFPGLRVVADAAAGLGPLGGIETALRAADGAAVLIVAWDMPFVPVPLLRGLRALGEAGADAVVPAYGAAPVYQPLCAYYGAAALEPCMRLLAQGERRAGALREALPTAIVLPERVLAEHGDPARLFMSIDSQEQLAALGGQLPRIGRIPQR